MAAAALESAPTETVKGREPAAASVLIQNISAPGRNPAQGDELEATYQYQDPDGDLEDAPQTRLQWAAAGANISGATTSRFTPTAEQNKQFLTVGVAPASQAPADPNIASTPAVSPESGGPVLPPRAQLAAEYIWPGANKSWGDAYMHCANAGARLPSASELQATFTTYTRANAVGEDSQNDLQRTYGVEPGYVTWANSGNDTRHNYVYMKEDGREADNSNSNAAGFACALSGASEGLPDVTGLSIPNAPMIGTPVTAQYTYVGNPTIPDRSRFQWYSATSADGNTNRTPISGATASSYTPTADDAGKWLVVEVTPASYDTVVGTPDTAVSSQAVGEADMITDVVIEKPTSDRPSFQVNYTFSGGTESGTTYQWYWKGQAVSGATGKTFAFSSLTIPSASAAEELKVEVTPRNSTGQQGALESTALGLQSSIAWNAPLGQSTWYDMSRACSGQGNGNKRPGTTAELQALHASLGNLGAYGVNTNNSYWTGTLGSAQGKHQRVHMASGSVTETDDWGSGERGLCVAGSAPAAPALGGVLVNGWHSTDSGFPTTGFDGAYLEIKGLKDSSAHNWAYRSTDTAKAVVYNDNNWWGGVTLKTKGAVSIEVYNISGGSPAVYVINPGRWFYNMEYKGSRGGARNQCPTGTNLPYWQDLTTSSRARGIGTLYTEWGNMSYYRWVAGSKDYYWTDSDVGINSAHVVRLEDGDLSSATEGTDANWTVCRDF